MPPLLIHASRALTPREEIRDAAILIEDGRVAAIGPRDSLCVPAGAREIGARGLTAVPGFIDVHIHGAGGHDVMEGSPLALDAISRSVARCGTTSLVATTVTASPDATRGSVEGIASYIREQQRKGSPDAPSAEILGIHLEGPFISRVRRGVHPPDWISAPSVPALQRYLDAAGGYARILTLAPEMDGALELIDVARSAGLSVAVGHTDATYEVTRLAVARGAQHAVHTFNAMRPFSHRETGVIGAVLTSPEMTAEVIADGLHVDAAAIRLLLAAKGVERVLLVSDATAATGMPDGTYTLGTFEVTVVGGVCRSREGKLAGSTLTLDRALRHVVALGVPLSAALGMLTTNPARLLGVAGRKGVLAPGADADIVLLDDALQVRGVLARGAAGM